MTLAAPNPSARPTIVIVDDDARVRTSTARLLEREGYFVTCFENGQSLLDSGIPPQTSGIILDVWMPGPSGLDVLRTLRDRGGPTPPVIMLTGRADVQLAVEAMKLGASDFLEKPYRANQLLGVLKRVGLANRTPSPSKAAQSAAAAKLLRLTNRQREVLKSLALGESNKRIAGDLGLSVRTVEAYRAQLMERLGARNTAEAIRIALLGDLLFDDAEALP